MILDRYHAAGLRRNPFAVSTGSDLDTFFVDRQLPDPPPPGSATLIQVIGDKGAGKSTQLHAWRRAARGPYHYVPAAPYRDRWALPPVEQLVYADEVDRMPAPLRWRWFRQLAAANATVVAGTHVDLERRALRSGLSVVTHHLGAADLATIRSVLNGRVALALASTKSFALSETEIVEIHARADGSLRQAEVLAHQVVAQRVHDASPLTLDTKVVSL